MVQASTLGGTPHFPPVLVQASTLGGTPHFSPVHGTGEHPRRDATVLTGFGTGEYPLGGTPQYSLVLVQASTL